MKNIKGEMRMSIEKFKKLYISCQKSKKPYYIKKIRELNIAPVSYTHLDVYKRQIMAIFLTLPSPFNKKRRNYQSIFILLKRDNIVYKPIVVNYHRP